MYEEEEAFLEESKHILTQKDNERIRIRFAEIISAYENLLQETRLLTKVSDRVQNKLVAINEEIIVQAGLLEEKAEHTFAENHKLHSENEILEEMVMKRTSELFETMQNLERVSDEFEHFVYRTAHDIMGPIARIKGLCHVAHLEKACIFDYFSLIQKDSDLLHKIVLKLVNAHSIKHHRPEEKTVYLSESFDRAHARVDKKIHQKSLTIRKNLTGVRDFLLCDEELLDTVFESLLEFIYGNINQVHNKPHLNFNVISLEEETDIFFEYTGIKLHENEDLFKIFNQTNFNKDILGVELFTARQAAKKLNAELLLVFSNEVETIFLLKIKQRNAG
jgi:light-regulated signal transduction histidine kinase (bacteriophytochrome)